VEEISVIVSTRPGLLLVNRSNSHPLAGLSTSYDEFIERPKSRIVGIYPFIFEDYELSFGKNKPIDPPSNANRRARDWRKKERICGFTSWWK
jgi:hypothetical protein